MSLYPQMRNSTAERWVHFPKIGIGWYNALLQDHDCLDYCRNPAGSFEMAHEIDLFISHLGALQVPIEPE